MKRIILDKLDNIIFKNNCDINEFIGFDVIKNIDVHGNKYELKNDEEKYYLLAKFEGNSMFVSESHILNTLLGGYIKEIESGSIYDHGYPESRLIPSSHYEDCQEGYLDHVSSDIDKKIVDIISQYF